MPDAALLLAALPIDVATFLVLFTRIGAVLMLLPAFSDEAVPPNIRLLMALGFTLGTYGLLSGQVAPVAANGDTLPLVVVTEMLTGLALGMIVKMLFSAAAMAGGIATQQVGLASALVADSSMGGQTGILSRFVALAALVTCMAACVHHLWIGSIVESYRTFPVGGLPPAADFAQLAVRVIGHAMSLGISLAAPLILYGAIFNIGLGLAARVAPSIQVFFISQPLNLLLGFSVLAMALGSMLTAFAAAMADFMHSGWGL